MYGNQGRGGPRDGGPRFAPVKVGEEMDVKIESVGEKGDGVAKVKGYVIFVPGAKTGEDVHIKISKVFKNVGFGEVMGKAAPKEEQEGEGSEEEYSEEESAEEESAEEEPKKEKTDSENFGEEDSEDFGEDEE